jgi:hypothetical protein
MLWLAFLALAGSLGMPCHGSYSCANVQHNAIAQELGLSGNELGTQIRQL